MPLTVGLAMETIEPDDGEIPTRKLTWKPLGFLRHIMCRTIDDRFPIVLWEVWFCSTLGVPIPALIGPPQQCACNDFRYDSYGDHLQTCQVKSAVSQVHEWTVYRSEKPQEHAKCLIPPRTLILDFTVSHTCYGCSIQHTTGQLTHTRRSDGG
jgi:hypothetical protein